MIVGSITGQSNHRSLLIHDGYGPGLRLGLVTGCILSGIGQGVCSKNRKIKLVGSERLHLDLSIVIIRCRRGLIIVCITHCQCDSRGSCLHSNHRSHGVHHIHRAHHWDGIVTIAVFGDINNRVGPESCRVHILQTNGSHGHTGIRFRSRILSRCSCIGVGRVDRMIHVAQS